MSYERFEFDGWVPSWTYPKGNAFKMGRGYQFSVKPQLPIQRTIKISFDGGLQWRFDAEDEVDIITEPALNMGALESFYERHLAWKTFILPTERWGDILVKFSADNPLEVPKAKAGGTGWTEGFELMVVEQSA